MKASLKLWPGIKKNSNEASPDWPSDQVWSEIFSSVLKLMELQSVVSFQDRQSMLKKSSWSGT